jgi:hypothetical protein
LAPLSALRWAGSLSNKSFGTFARDAQIGFVDSRNSFHDGFATPKGVKAGKKILQHFDDVTRLKYPRMTTSEM